MQSAIAHTHLGASILLVEDDQRLAELVRSYLAGHGFCVSVEHRGDQAVAKTAELQPQLLILDIGLPGTDGFSVCKALRPNFTRPILILTARDNDIDHVLGLELGADDYVTKPVEPRVLLARVTALLRRAQAAVNTATNTHRPLHFGGLTINTASRSVALHGQTVSLSSNEFDLLLALAQHAGHVQSREALYLSLYKREYDGLDRTLDVRISHLRKKFGGDAENAERIKTIWGQGYLFAPDAW
jgi:DNA-binding response OmpR family regulator